jgi:hypothetical protein
MTRLDKKYTHKDEEIPDNRGLFGLMDSVMLKTFRITNEELDKICEIATDDELELFTKEDRTIRESRQLLTFLKDKVYVKEPKY